MPFHMGPMEIGIIVVLVLMIFGVGRLPQVGGAIGKSIREFRKARAGEAEEDKSKDKVAPSQAKRKPKTRANSRRPKSTLL